MNLFQNNSSSSRRDTLLKRYSSARTDLLAIICLTVLNIVLFIAGSETVMLFSATVPYFSAVMGFMLNDGTIEDIYIETGIEIGMAIALFILGVYFLCWLMSKKNYKWLILATVLFCIDTLITFWIYSDALIEGIIDIAIHIFIVACLISGIISSKKLQNMPEETIEAAYSIEPDGTVGGIKDSHTQPIRYADDDRIKSKQLCSAEYMGMNIIYRRVKSIHINQLIVNGVVYDETEKMLIEPDHELYCNINGYNVVAGYSSKTCTSYIKVNGETIKAKVRIW